MHSYIFDIETRGFLDGLSNPDDLFIITAINLDTGERLAARPHECEALARELYGAKSLIGHNIFGFDLPALQKCLGWWDRLEDPRDVDTMINTRLIWSHLKELDFARLEGNPDYIPKNLIGSHSLKAWGLRIGEHKDEYSGGFGEFRGNVFVCPTGRRNHLGPARTLHGAEVFRISVRLGAVRCPSYGEAREDWLLFRRTIRRKTVA